MTAVTYYGKYLNDPGLRGGHVYTIIGYDPATDNVLLRNPWGNNKDLAPYNKGIDNPGYPKGDSGYFWMSLTNFKRDFINIGIEK
jgi:C1A family cysteine protease